MEIKIFGRSLFSVKTGKAELAWAQASQPMPMSSPESKFLPDFLSTANESFGSNFLSLATVVSDLNPSLSSAEKTSAEPEPSVKTELTPKDVFNMKMLHDEAFTIKTDPAYIDAQLADFKDKLGLIKSEEYDMSRGVKEISSIIARLENRKRYAEFKDAYEEFPHTTTSRINSVIEANNYLKLGKLAQFLADMPKEATEAVKRYNKATDSLCGKQAVFYIIANKKDFEKTEKRRDPILLAQSPFGHFWQILGAWDEEMLLLEDL